MGCCFSQPEGPNSPYPGGAPSASARAINVPGVSSTTGAGTVSSIGGDVPSSAGTSSLPRTRTASLPPQVQQQQQQTTSSSHGHRHRREQQPLSQHINKPLKRRRWTSRNRVWTRHAIDRERVDFFDTRVTGRAEIWQTLRAALEILWEADLVAASRRADTAVENPDNQGDASSQTAKTAKDAKDGKDKKKLIGPKTKTETAIDAEMADAIATAQTMLDAADITLPTGDPAQGAYDTLGNYYSLPAWIVSDPTNIDNDPSHDLAEAKGVLDDDDDDDDDEEEGVVSEDGEFEDDEDGSENGNGVHGDEDADDVGLCRRTSNGQHQKNRRPSMRRRREEKGKAVAMTADQVAVRARLSATSRDVVIRLGREETVRSLAHHIAEEAKFPHKTRIRIAYLGKILKEGSSLEAQGWKEGHVVNALVFDMSQRNST